MSSCIFTEQASIEMNTCGIFGAPVTYIHPLHIFCHLSVHAVCFNLSDLRNRSRVHHTHDKCILYCLVMHIVLFSHIKNFQNKSL